MILRKFTYNWGLKLISVLIALGLWLVVVNLDDPEMSKTFTISVDVSNESYLSANNKVYEILSGSDTIRVTVTAKRSILAELASSDLQAVADLSNVNLDTAESTQQVPIEVTSRRYSGRVSLSAKSYYLRIRTDEKGTETFNVRATYDGTTASGYTVGAVTAMPNEIQISGAQTTLDKISYCEVNVSVEGAFEDFNTRLTPVFYDESGEVVDVSKMTLSQSDITVSVSMLSLKKVPVVYQTVGTPNEEFDLDSVSGSVTMAVIKGTEEMLQNITEIRVDDIDVEGISEDTVKSISISKYLPTGVRIASSESETSEVTITLKAMTIAEFNMLSTKVKVTGLSEEQKAAVAAELIHFTVRGETAVMENISAEDFTAEADLSEYILAGDYMVPITISGPSNVTVGPAVINVSITGDAPQDNSTTSDGDSGENAAE